MKNVVLWKSAADRLTEKNPKGVKIHKAFCALLDYIHRRNWQGACHASTTVLYSLLAVQGIEADICLGEVCFGNIIFDHSWVEVDAKIYDAAISNPLVGGVSFSPVFRGIELTTSTPTELRYGVPSGQGYDAHAKWIRSVSVSEYMRGFPNHPRGLLGLAKEIGVFCGLRLNMNALQQCAERAIWRERP